MSSSNIKYFQNFGKLLSFLLKEKELTGREFAQMIGKDESQVSHWVANRFKPFAKTYNKIASVLNCEIEDLKSKGWKLTYLTESSQHAMSASDQEMSNLEQNISNKFSEYEELVKSGGSTDADLELILNYALKEADALSSSLKMLQKAFQARLNKKAN